MNLKERLKKGDVVLGTFNMIPSAQAVEAIGYSGLDFIIIDTEHGPIGIESAENLVRAAEVAKMTPIIRVSHNEPHMILRALDIGASGVQVPHVSTKKEAEAVIEYSKYHPKGKRGFSPFTRAAKYGIEAEGHAAKSNKNTVVVVNVEGIDGIKNLNQIADVPDIDVIFIGPFDLSQSLGKPGDVYNPEVIKLIQDNVGVISNKGKACGSFAQDLKYMEILIESGVQYIACMLDTTLMLEACKNLKCNFNKLVKEKSSKHEKITKF